MKHARRARNGYHHVLRGNYKRSRREDRNSFRNWQIFFYPEDSIYIIVDGKTVIMDRKTAKKFVEAVSSVGFYHGFLK